MVSTRNLSSGSKKSSSEQKRTNNNESSSHRRSPKTMSHDEAGRRGAQVRWGSQKEEGAGPHQGTPRSRRPSGQASHSSEGKRGHAGANPRGAESHLSSSREEDKMNTTNTKDESMQKNEGLYHFFIESLQEILNCEKTILEMLPKIMTCVSSKELKESLKIHQDETQEQVVRLENIFYHLNISSEGRTCETMKCILDELYKLVVNETKSPTLDAIIISGMQKVEHYEIAAYGALESFAKHLDLKREIVKKIQETLREEKNADKKLTKIAEGTLFSEGVVAEAAEAVKTC